MTTVPDPANPFSIASGGGTPTAFRRDLMLTETVRLHDALQAVRLAVRPARVADPRAGLATRR